MEGIKNISLIGSGNVATHLAKALFDKGLRINQIYSKHQVNAEELAAKVNANPIHKIDELNADSDLYIICLKDDVIEQVAQQFNIHGKTVVHSSGSIAINVLNIFDSYGIFYPLQTFSKNRAINLKTVPFCIEANNQETEQKLIQLAKLLSDNVQLIDSEQRKTIHLAAVFACNFSNNMYAIADEILSKNGMDLGLLKPLIKETAIKIENSNPKDVQTGPAKRNDQKVIKNHLEMLADSKDYQDIYRIITNNIIKNN